MLINSLRKFYDADKKLRLTFAEDKAREDFISQNITTESILMLGWLMQTKQHFLSAFLVLLHSAPDRTIAILKNSLSVYLTSHITDQVMDLPVMFYDIKKGARRRKIKRSAELS